jgi:hypothetical protein
MWETRRQQWIVEYEKKGKNPSDQSKDADEKRAGQWQGNMRQMYKAQKLTAERILLLNSTEGWGWDGDNFEANLEQWIVEYEKKRKNPSQTSTDPDEKRAGKWQSHMRQNYKKQKLTAERIAKLEATEGWEWEADNFEANLEQWIVEFSKKRKNPSHGSTDPDEKRAGQWQGSMRHNYKKQKLTAERIVLLEATEGWEWSAEDPFEENLEQWISFFSKKRKTPSHGSRDPEEKSSGQWQSWMRHNYKAQKLTPERILLLNSTEGWEWESKDPFEENLEKWIVEFSKKRKTPSSHSNNPDEKRAGIWQSKMRQNYKKQKLTAERILLLNSTEGWGWSK